MRRLFLFGWLLIATIAFAQNRKAGDVADFVSVDASVVVLNHVRVIDGTGAAAKEDQAVVIANGKIQSIAAATAGIPAEIPQGAQIVDGSGYTVIPGIVGMHNHLYYTDSAAVQFGPSHKLSEPGLIVAEIPFTAPRLYLAAGVTTMRTTGSLEPYTDLKVKSRIDANLMPGPSMDATAPYLEGAPTIFAQMHELTGPDDAKRMVDYWAAEGMTSYKAIYEHHPRGAGRGDPAGARAPAEADWSSVFGNLAGSCGAGDRRLRARSGVYRYRICSR